MNKEKLSSVDWGMEGIEGDKLIAVTWSIYAGLPNFEHKGIYCVLLGP